MSFRSVALLLASLVLVAACSRKEPVARDSSALESHAAPAVSAAGGASRERQLVRTAELQLEVKDYAPARAQLDAELQRAGGYVAQASVEHADGTVTSASLELRIPAAELDAFLAALARLGTVLDEQLHSSEISDDYYDVSARLSTARQLEQRLLDFARVKTSDVKDLLEVERELTRVRENIETLQGRLQRYDHDVALSALSLRIVSRERASVGAPLGLGAQLRHSLGESAHALLGTGRATLLLLAVLMPWLPLLGFAGHMGRRLLRRRGSSA